MGRDLIAMNRARGSLDTLVEPHPRGVCVLFTGLGGAGKSTATRILLQLLENCGRTVTVLDDDISVLDKRWLEPTNEERLLRKGFVAKEVVRHGGVALCVAVSAHDKTRQSIRDMVGPDNFILVYFDVSREVSDARKASRRQQSSYPKRAKASLRRIVRRLMNRRRLPYEPPACPDLTLDPVRKTPDECAHAVFELLRGKGYVVQAD